MEMELFPEKKFSALQPTPKLSPEEVVIQVQEQWGAVTCFTSGISSYAGMVLYQLSRYDNIAWRDVVCQGH